MKKTILSIMFFTSIVFQLIAQPSFYITPGEDKLTLNGNGGGIGNPTHYDVYRGTSDSSIDLYRTFSDGYNFQWEDTLVEDRTMYYYQLRARDENSGSASLISSVSGAVALTGLGNHYVFDGTDDRLTLFNTNIVNTANRLEFRVRIDEAPTGMNMEILRVNETGNDNNNTIRIYHVPNRLEFIFYRDDLIRDGDTFRAETTNIADGQWHQIEITNLGNSNTAIRVDGTSYPLLIGAGAPVGASYDFGSSHRMIIGGQSNATTSFLKGAVDDIKLLNGINVLHHWRLDEPENSPKAFNSESFGPHLNKENGVGSSFSDFTNITATGYTDSTLIQWNPVADIQGYEIWRGIAGGTLSFLTSVNMSELSFVDKQVTNGTSYEYQVRAVRQGPFPISNTDIAMPNNGFANSLYLDGLGEVQFPHSGLFSGNSGTIDFRFKTSSSDVTSTIGHSILNKHDGTSSGNGFNFVLTPSNLSVQLKIDGVTNASLTPNPSMALADDEWHHVALTYTWGGTSKLYIDGVEQDEVNNTPTIDLSVQPMRVGKSPDDFWEPFKGFVDELRVWNRALDDTEILDVKDERVPGNTQGIQGVWRFDLPVSDGVAYDDGLNEYDGYILGNVQVLTAESSTVNGSYDAGEVTLNWDIQAAGAIDQYVITRNRLSPQPFSEELATLPATASSYTDTNPIYSDMYEYVVEAKSGGATVASATDVVSIKDDFGNELFLRQSNSDDYVAIDESLLDNQIGTIEFRFKGNTAPPTGQSYTILNRHNQSGSNNGFNFIHTASNLFVQIKQAGTSVNLTDNENLLDGEWHHVTLVYNWNGENQLFVDGQLKDSKSVSNIAISDEPLRIGLSPDSFWAPFEGSFDELRIWSKQLTGAEINALKDIRLPGDTPDLGGVWHFDESLGTTAYDNGSNNFDGSLQGNAIFYRAPGVLSFSSNTGGFSESSGNGGGIEGSMVVTITGNKFENPGSIVNTNLYDVYFPVVLGNDPDGIPILENLFTGLNPVLTVAADGFSATLTFTGQAIFHEGENSTNEWVMSFSNDVFVDSYPIFDINQAETGVDYTLTDNVVPTLTQSIPDFELAADDDPVEINLNNYFFDPDFDQNLQYTIEKNNNIVGTSINGSLLTFEPTPQGGGSTEIQVTLADNTGGEVSDTFVVSVDKQSQNITFNPIPDVDLESQNTVNLSATASSGLTVQFELLSGDGSIANNILTINQTGFFGVEATQPGNDFYEAATPVIVSFSVTDSSKDDQTITFTDDLNGLTYGDTDINLMATASSGLEVSYTTTGPVQMNESTLSIHGAGVASVTAMQSGDADFNPATPVTIDFTIEKRELTAAADDQSMTFGDDLPEFTVSIVGFVAGDDELDLEVLPTGQSSATSSSDAGTYAIEATGGSDDNYSFDYVDGTLTINKADQVITFPAINDLDLAQQDTRGLSAFSSSGLDVTFDLLEGIGIIQGNILTAEGIGIFRVMATQNGNANYNAATPVTQTFVVSDSDKMNQTITFDKIPDAAYGDVVEFSATASSGLDINFEVISGDGTLSGNSLTLTGIGTIEIEATQQGSDVFNPAPIVTMSFEVSKAPLTVTAEDKVMTEGNALPQLTLNYDGFKLQEDASVLDEIPTVSTAATDASPAGDYVITLEGGSDDLYELNLVNGTLTIEAEQVLGVDDVELTVYPNPVVDRLQVKGGKIAGMRLVSMDGKLIRSVKDTTVMDVSNLKQGNYVLQLIAKTGETSTHLIIKN